MVEVPSDSLLAIEHLSEECRELEVPVTVLKSQVYTLIPDKTKVEQEMDELRRSLDVRIFQLRTDKHDVAILLKRDHDQDLEAVAQSLPVPEGEILLKCSNLESMSCHTRMQV